MKQLILCFRSILLSEKLTEKNDLSYMKGICYFHYINLYLIHYMVHSTSSSLTVYNMCTIIKKKT